MKKEIDLIVDFVEGNLNIMNLKQELDSNKKIQKLLRQKIKVEYLKHYNFNHYDYIYGNLKFLNGKWDNPFARYSVWWSLNEWLKYNKIQCCATQKYLEDSRLLSAMQPSWLEVVDDQGIFDQLLANLPRDLSRSKQIAWGKSKLKELFKFDKTYPRWIQCAEWPIKNGKPLVFSHQQKLSKMDERVLYYFYDPETKEKEIIEQMY